MKNLFALTFLIFSLLIWGQLNGQITITGKQNTTPNLSSTYSTLNAAITALNAVTAISGPVTIKVTTSSYSETTPIGGFQIVMTNVTNTISTPVVIDGDYNATITAFSPQASSSLNDAIFKIIGADFVTIQKFKMQENGSNTITAVGTNTMTEWGVALLRRASGQNGAQNNSIIDNDISLNKNYPNSFGVYSNVRHLPATPTTTTDISNITGSNLGNRIYYNRINNVNMGIAFIGCNVDSRMDASNDIGGSSTSTGNTITNWGGNNLPTASFSGNDNAQYYGILMRNQKNNNISWNTVVSSTSLSGTVGAVRGIHNGTITGTVTTGFSTTIDYNTITITDSLPNGTGTTGRLDGIVCTNKVGVLSISFNTINGLAVKATGSNRFIRCISNSASATDVSIAYNTISGNTSTASANASGSIGSFSAIEQTGIVSNTVVITGNLVGDASTSTPAITYLVTPNSSSEITGVTHNPTTPTGSTGVEISYNSFFGFVAPGSAANRHIYINLEHTTTIASVMRAEFNEFVNIDARTSNDVYFIQSTGSMVSAAGALLSISNNSITGSFTKSLGGGNVYLHYARGSSRSGNTMIEEGNNFSNITLTGSTVMRGWYNNEGTTAAGPEKLIKNNVFENWVCGSSGTGEANAIYCDWASGNSEISGNILSNISSYCSLNGIADASSTATTMTYNGNKMSGLSSNSALNGINLKGGGNVARTLINTSITLFSTTGFYVFAVQLSSTFLTGTGSNLDIYYNTIYLSATSSNSFFTSSCLAIAGNASSNNSVVRVRNNIFINNSVPKTDPNDPTKIGKSSIIYNQGAVGQIANYHPSSNNNSFWIGTRLTSASLPSTAISDATHVIFQDGPTPSPNPGPTGVDRVTLANFQAYIPSGLLPAPGGTESLSFMLMPKFINAIPPILSSDLPIDLHLLSDCGNNAIFNKGNNQGILAARDWAIDLNPRFTLSPFITDIGADQHILTNSWTGAAGTQDWTNSSNWTAGLPFPNDAEMNVYIPDAIGARPQPLIASGASWQVNNVYFQTGLTSSFLPLLTNYGTLKVAGRISGDAGSLSNFNGTLVVGSIEMNGTGTCRAQTLGGLVFKDKKVFDLRIRNNVNISSITNDGVKVVGELNFGSLSGLTLNTGPSTLTNNENLTLVSTSSRTANVAQITNGNTITGDVTVERYIHTGSAAASGPIPAQHARSWQLLSTPTSGQTVRQSWMEGMVTGNDNLQPGYGTNIPGTGSTGNGFDQAPAPPSGDGIKWWNPGFPGAYIFLSNTSVPLNNPRGYFLFVRGDRSVYNFSGANSAPVPTTLRQKGALFQPSNPPAQTTFPSDVNNLSLFISVGNPYASAINLNAMVSTGGFNNIGPIVYVYDPALGSLGGYQVLQGGLAGYASLNATNTQYYNQGVQYPNIESGNAFYVSPASSSAGSITFTEPVKSALQRLVNRASSFADSVKMNATLFLTGNKVADGNVVFFGSAYSNGVDSNDVIKLYNPGENFFVLQDTGTYIVAKRNLISSSDSIFYSFSNLAPETYKLKFGPSNLAEGGLTAILIDNYRDTAYAVSLNADTEISFVVDSNATSMTGRFTLVFTRASFSKMANVSAKPFQDVFPNPVINGEFFVELNNEFSGNCNIQVVSSTGQVIFKQVVNQVENRKTIRVNLGNKLPSGIYYVIISDEKGKKTTQHIIVQ